MLLNTSLYTILLVTIFTFIFFVGNQNFKFRSLYDS